MEHNRKTRKISRFLQNFYKQIQYQMGVVTMRTATSGFLQKLLSREFGTAITAEAVTRMGINYVLSTPEIDVALVGMRNRREVELNVALVDDVNARYDLKELHHRFHPPASK